MHRSQRLGTSATAAVLTAAVASGQQVIIERIGPGGSNSSIADNGLVVYSAWQDKHLYLHGTTGDSDNWYFDPGDWERIAKTRVNSEGQVAYFAENHQGNATLRYSDDQGIVDINTLGVYSVLLSDMNESGEIVGQMIDNDHGYGSAAFLYTDQTGLVLPDFVDPDWGTSIAVAINDSGQIAVRYEQGGMGSSARYTPGEGLANIGSLGGLHTAVTGVNNHGDMTGWADLPGGGYHAFLYSDVGGLQDLDLDGGVHQPVDVNDDQWVLAYGNDPSLWTPDTGWVTLDSLLPDGVDAEFHDLLSINNAGQIVGMGRLGGSWGTLRMTIHSIPTPLSFMPIALAGAVASRRRRR